MQEKIVTRILKQAARAEGSTQALASRLNAPEPTLLRWMDGRAQTPLRAFLAVLDFLMQLEGKNKLDPAEAPGQPDKLVFPLGPLLARCARCDGAEFRLLEPGTLRLTSPLGCTACGEPVVHGRLLAQLAKDAVHQSRAVAARTRRAVKRAQEIIERGQGRLAASARRLHPSEDTD
jgi:hypothetical protein